jgi:uncharacterized membrane protein YfcA
VGFLAQLIDGALGMAYGVSSTTFLLSIGVSPAAASASVHTAEIFTTGVSGWSHWRLGNVDTALFKRLIIPGILGGVAGAYILSAAPGDIIKPYVAAYLLFMGLLILVRALRQSRETRAGAETIPSWAGSLTPSAAAGGGQSSPPHSLREAPAPDSRLAR